MQQLSTRQMLAQMKNGEPFTITFTTFDKRRKEKNGRVLTFEGILCQKPEGRPAMEGRSLTEMEQATEELERLRRNPHHHHHFTRNLQVCVNGHPTAEVRKFHPPLVSRFNGMTVVP